MLRTGSNLDLPSISCGSLTTVVLQDEGSASRQTQPGGSGLRIYVHRRRIGGPATPPHSLVASDYTHGLRWGYSCARPPHGEKYQN